MIYKRHIFLQDTDATGVIYFAQLPKFALEAFELLLVERGLPLNGVLRNKKYCMPIARVECDFAAPIQVNDEIEVRLSLEKVGESSFSISSKMFKGSELVGSSLVVQVVIGAEDKRPQPIPEELKEILLSLPQSKGV